MGTQKTRGLAARLEPIRRRFENWRRTREMRAHIPGALWMAAVKVAGVCGISRTAHTLGVNYTALKRRVEQQEATAPTGPEPGAGLKQHRPAPGGVGPSPAFLELTPCSRTGRCHCLLELEDGSGAKMRVELREVETPDLAALGRSFWEFRS